MSDENENESFGLDKITDDDINSAAKNRAVDLTRVEKPRLPKRDDVPESSYDFDGMEIIRTDDYGQPEKEIPRPAEELQLEKITENDFLPEKRLLPINQNKLTGRTPTDVITKDRSEAAPPDPHDREYGEMARISERDERTFEEHNTKVDLSPVTDKLCARCGRKLTDLEKKYFNNKCAVCYHTDMEAYRKGCTNRYMLIVALFILVVVITLVEQTVDNRQLTIATKVITAVAVSVISLYFTMGILAKKAGTNMPQIDYIIIGAVVVVLSIALSYYLSSVYLIIALVVFIRMVIKNQKRVKSEARNYDLFDVAKKSAEAKAAAKAAEEESAKTGENPVANNENTAENGEN